MSRPLARDLFGAKRTIADYDYYADKDRYVSKSEVEEEAGRLVANILKNKAAARAAAIQARRAKPRDAVELLGRLTMTPEQRKQLILTRRMFPGLDLSDEILQKLEDAGKDVVPINYYQCPADWNEYTDVSKEALQNAGVVWQNASGNFCLPPGTVGAKEEDRVDSFESNRLPSKERVLRQVAAQTRALRQLRETPEERAERIAAEEKEETRRKARKARREQFTERQETAVEKSMREREIRNLMEILRDLPIDNNPHAGKTVEELRQAATTIYDKAHKCANKGGGNKTTCAGANDDGECQYGVGGSCFPREWAKTAQEELKAIKDANKAGYALSRRDADSYAENEAMVEWWQEYYPKYRAYQKIKKAKESDTSSVVRSLMSAY